MRCKKLEGSVYEIDIDNSIFANNIASDAGGAFLFRTAQVRV